MEVENPHFKMKHSSSPKNLHIKKERNTNLQSLKQIKFTHQLFNMREMNNAFLPCIEIIMLKQFLWFANGQMPIFQ